jgi:hypothetical protein
MRICRWNFSLISAFFVLGLRDINLSDILCVAWKDVGFSGAGSVRSQDGITTVEARSGRCFVQSFVIS